MVAQRFSTQSRSFVDYIQRGGHVKSGIPSVVLHSFCFFSICSLLLFEDDIQYLRFFTLPTLAFLLPMFVYTRSKIATYMFAQYIYMCWFISALVSGSPGSEANTESAVLVVLYLPILFLIVKLRSREDLPILGPAFVYIFLFSVFSEDFTFTKYAPYLALLYFVFIAKNRSKVTPYVHAAILVFLSFAEELSSAQSILTSALIIASIYLSRFFRRRDTLNMRLLTLEEILLAVSISQIVVTLTDFSMSASFLMTACVYFLVALVTFARKKMNLLQISVIGFTTSFFCGVWQSEAMDIFASGYLEKTIIILAVAALLFKLGMSKKLFEVRAACYAVVATNATVLTYLVFSKEPEIYTANIILISQILCSILFVLLFRYSGRLTSEDSWKHVISLKDIVIFRRWLKTSQSIIVTLPIVGTLVVGLAYIATNIRRALSNDKNKRLLNIVLVWFFCVEMIFAGEWTKIFFTNMGIGIETQTGDDGQLIKNIIEIDATALQLTTYAIFGSILAFVGARFKLEYLIALGVFIPLGAIYLLFISSLLSNEVPFTLYFIAATLVYVGSRYSIEMLTRGRPIDLQRAYSGDALVTVPVASPAVQDPAPKPALSFIEPKGTVAVIYFSAPEEANIHGAIALSAQHQNKIIQRSDNENRRLVTIKAVNNIEKSSIASAEYLSDKTAKVASHKKISQNMHILDIDYVVSKTQPNVFSDEQFVDLLKLLGAEHIIIFSEHGALDAEVSMQAALRLGFSVDIETFSHAQ